MNTKAKFHFGSALLASVAACLFAGGCATKNVDPAAAKAGTGYVDFYAEPAAPLCWQIGKVKPADGSIKVVYEEFELRNERVLRMAFKPGVYQFQITFLNRAIPDPAVEDVTVSDGMITPVRVTLIEFQKVLIENRQVRVGATYYGRYGRSTRLRPTESGMYRVEAEAQPSLPYQPKTRMPYATESNP